MTQNSNNQDFQHNADGAQLGGGVIKRFIKWLGSDITLTGSGENTYTFPAVTDTLVGRTSTDTLTNKTIDGSNNTITNLGTSSLGESAVTGSKLTADAITLGYAQSTTDFSATTTALIPGLTKSVTIPAGGRRIEIEAFAGGAYNESTSGGYVLSIWEDTVGTGTLLQQTIYEKGTVVMARPVFCKASVLPSAGSKTYSVGWSNSNGGTAHTNGAANNPVWMSVKLA